MSDKKLLITALVMLLFPILIDTLIVVFDLNLSDPAIQMTRYFHNKVGITENNFPVWLVEKQNYTDVVRFNLGGSFIRMQEFIEGNRAFKVLGLFLIGLYIGRHRFYARLDEIKPTLKKICFYGFLIGIPTSLLYSWDSMNGRPLGMIGGAVLYAVSILPMSLAYITALCLWYLQNKKRKIFHIIAAPGRMALTNYLMQSVFGMIIFYGIGFGLGAKIGLVYVELIAVGVYLIQILYSYFWMHYLRYGPFEWGWRMLTYGKALKLTK